MISKALIGRAWALRPDSPLVTLGFLATVIGSMVGVVAVFQVTRMMVGSTGAPCIVASMGASAVILYGLPDTSAARLWSLFGGHLLSAVVGILAARWLGDRGDAAALAVGGALLVMGLFRCMHPPGGATALTAVIGGHEVQELGFLFLLSPLLMNLLALGAIHWIFRKLRHLSTSRLPLLLGTFRRADPAQLQLVLEDELIR